MTRLHELAAGQPRGGRFMTDRMPHVQPAGAGNNGAALICGIIVQSATENVAGSKLACDSVSCKGAERPSSQATDSCSRAARRPRGEKLLPGPLPPRDLGNRKR